MMYLNQFHKESVERKLKKQIDILREMLVYPALQIHLDNLYVRETGATGIRRVPLTRPKEEGTGIAQSIKP